jgi:MOSC domain-containing protein YiiM
MSGSVVSIHISPEASGEMKRIDEARAVPGKGLEGDRYFGGGGTWSETPGTGRQVTLIEVEAIEALARDNDVVIDPGLARRNIVTKGVALNDLVDKEFKVGEVLLKGTRLSEPCAHLEKLSKPGVVKGLIHRGGLRADVLEGGVIRPGDPVESSG